MVNLWQLHWLVRRQRDRSRTSCINDLRRNIQIGSFTVFKLLKSKCPQLHAFRKVQIYYESKIRWSLIQYWLKVRPSCLLLSLSLLGFQRSWIYSTYCDFLLTVCHVGIDVILAMGIYMYSSIISTHYCDLFTCLWTLTWWPRALWASRGCINQLRQLLFLDQWTLLSALHRERSH